MPSVHPELIRIAARQVRVWRNPITDNQRPNLFLIHGGLGDAQWHWHSVWETLAESFNIAAPDLPRFGGTVALPDASFAELIEWLARVQELVSMPQATFIGNSFGAGLARLYASAHPERVTKLILVDGGQIPHLPIFVRRIMSANFLLFAYELMRRRAFSDRGLQRAFGNSTPVPADVLRASQDSSHGFVALMRQVILSDIPQNQKPAVPTLLIWGDQDKLAPPQLAQEIAAEIPDATLAIIKNAGHMPQLQDPLSFVKIVQNFAQRDFAQP